MQNANIKLQIVEVKKFVLNSTIQYSTESLVQYTLREADVVNRHIYSYNLTLDACKD